eukprot:20856_1
MRTSLLIIHLCWYFTTANSFIAGSYFVGPSAMNWASAKSYCESHGSHLASIHSVHDWKSAKAECISGSAGNECWVGLNHQNMKDLHENVDDTLKDCIYLDDYQCNGLKYPICDPLLSTDPSCDYGILSNNVCCAFSCGKCEGNGCELRPDGDNSCCPSLITMDGNSCADQTAPCLVTEPLFIARKRLLAPEDLTVVYVAVSEAPTGIIYSSGVRLRLTNDPYVVLRWKGETFWGYSFWDNRHAMQIVSFDEYNNKVREWYKEGARYLRNISIDVQSETVYFIGQHALVNNLTFYEIDPTSNPSSNPTANPTMIPTSPTSDPTKNPSLNPTANPSMIPTNPTSDPTLSPTNTPTSSTNIPTSTPSTITNDPSSNPTMSTTVHIYDQPNGTTANPAMSSKVVWFICLLLVCTLAQRPFVGCD